MTPLSFVGLLHTTPRVGQNAVLRALRGVVPDADEWGRTQALSGRLVTAVDRPVSEMGGPAFAGFDMSGVRWGAPVWMRRCDKIDQAISWALAARTGRYLSTDPDGSAPEYQRRDIDDKLGKIFDGERRWDQHFRDLGVTPLTIWYECDVADDPSVAARAILDWWQLDGEPAEPDIVRHDADVKRRWRQMYEAGL